MKKKSNDLEVDIETVIVTWDGDNNKPYEIPVKYAKIHSQGSKSIIKERTTMNTTLIKPTNSSELIIPELELTKQEMDLHPKPIWIINQFTQETYYANQAACAANKRPKEDLEGQAISALWEEENLNSLTKAVFTDKKLNGHTNQGWRYDWEETEHGNLLIRVPYLFNVDYRLINFRLPDGSEVPCRYELVQDAVRVRSLVV